MVAESQCVGARVRQNAVTPTTQIALALTNLAPIILAQRKRGARRQPSTSRAMAQRKPAPAMDAVLATIVGVARIARQDHPRADSREYEGHAELAANPHNKKHGS